MKFLPSHIKDRLLPIVLAQAVGLACGVAGVHVATRLIAPTDYGIYGLYLTFVPLGMWVFHAGLIKFVNRHWMESPDRAGLLREVFMAGRRTLPWLAAATAVAAFLIAPGQGVATWSFLFGATILLSLGALAQTALQAQHSHWADLLVASVGSISRSFLPPLLYIFAGSSLLALQAGFSIHAGLLALAAAFVIARQRPATTSERQLTRVYEGPLFIALALAGWALTGLNRWIVAAFFGHEKAGYFTLAGNVATIVTVMLGVVLMQYFQPSLFSAAKEEPVQRRDLARRFDRIAAAYSVLSLVGVVTIHFIAPWLVGPLINEKYRASLEMILGAGCFSSALITAQIFHTMLLSGHREKACGLVDLSTGALLALGGVATAAFGERIFLLWMTASSLVPWCVTRPLARHQYFKPAAASTSSPAR